MDMIKELIANYFDSDAGWIAGVFIGISLIQMLIIPGEHTFSYVLFLLEKHGKPWSDEYLKEHPELIGPLWLIPFFLNYEQQYPEDAEKRDVFLYFLKVHRVQMLLLYMIVAIVLVYQVIALIGLDLFSPFAMVLTVLSVIFLGVNVFAFIKLIPHGVLVELRNFNEYGEARWKDSWDYKEANENEENEEMYTKKMPNERISSLYLDKWFEAAEGKLTYTEYKGIRKGRWKRIEYWLIILMAVALIGPMFIYIYYILVANPCRSSVVMFVGLAGTFAIGTGLYGVLDKLVKKSMSNIAILICLVGGLIVTVFSLIMLY